MQGGGANPERRRKIREMHCKQYSIYAFPKRFNQTSLILSTKYFHNRIIIFYLELCSDKKEEKNSLTYKEIQSGAVAKSYMRKGFLIYEEMRFDFFFSVIFCSTRCSHSSVCIGHNIFPHRVMKLR
jgi:hypothetical protein